MRSRGHDIDLLLPALRGVDLFDGLDDIGLRAVAEAGALVVADPGERLARQGDVDESCYLVVEGRLSAQSSGSDGRRRPSETLERGAYFGELALIGRGDRGATVTADAPSTLLELRRGSFEGVMKRHPHVRTRLERRRELELLTASLRSGRAFSRLSEAARRRVLDGASLLSAMKGELFIREGARADAFYVLRAGNVAVLRADAEGGEALLAYLGPEDVFGEQELATASPSYGASVRALEPAEAIRIPREIYVELHREQPALFSELRAYSLDRIQRQSMIGPTSMSFVRDVLEGGLGQARSALVVDMDACVRCGSCVQACADTYGLSRLTRRGRRMKRRVELLEAGRHQSLYFPTSCLQCASPECMVGCPAGAIARDAGGEVFIRDTCIGCGACARGCEFGNISIAKLAEEGEQIAVKCDVCFGRERAACVEACPTQALLRVDPVRYFEELRETVPSGAGERKDAKTTLARPRRLLDALLPTLAVALGLGVARLAPPETIAPLWSGLGAGLTLLALAAIGVRKRLRTTPLGAYHRWVRAHALLGAAFVGLAALHVGGGVRSVLAGALSLTALLATLLGWGGQLLGAALPRKLARSEDEALLPEDVAARIDALGAERDALLAGLEGRSRAITLERAEQLARRPLGGSPREIAELVKERARRLPRLPDREQELSLGVAERDGVRRQLAANRRWERALTAWVPLHLVAACAALALLAAHVAVALFG